MKPMRMLVLLAFLFWALSEIQMSLGFGEVRQGPMLVTQSMIIDRDLEFAQTAFVIKGSNLILDLGGHTITFNTANFSETVNRDFEDWEGNRPVGWHIIAGKVGCEPALYFGKFDLILSPGGSIESAPIRLKGGKTYLAFAFAKGAESDRAVLSIVKAGDKSVLAEKTWGSSVFSRGYASRGSADTDLVYKPKGDLDVILQFRLIGSTPCRIGMIDIKPAFDYGVITNNYHQPVDMPELNPSWFRGASKNILIRNGRIVQGNGQGVRSAGIRIGEGEAWSIENLEILINGINTDGILGEYLKNITVNSSKIESSSIGVFNRMHGNAGIKLNKTTGSTIIKNNSITNVPQMGISIYGCFREEDRAKSLISGNRIKQKELVTEGYGIAVSGIMNYEISYNHIEPFQGRGILVDAASGCSSGKAGTLGLNIHHNRILGLYEIGNFEYNRNELECSGIRIRNWGEEDQSHRELKIYSNTITGRTDAIGVHRIYGFNITAASPKDSIEIFDNEVSVKTKGPGNKATSLIFQNTKLVGKNYVYVSENRLSSNAEILRFGGPDGADNRGIVLEKNTFIRLNDPAPIGKPFIYGYWNGQGVNNVWAKNITTSSDVDPTELKNLSFEGTGFKNLLIGRHKIEIIVRVSESPITGALVTLRDDSDRVLNERATDQNGKAVLFSPYVYYSVTPPGTLVQKKFKDNGSVTITVFFGGNKIVKKILVAKDMMLDIDLNNDGIRRP
jgi:hypothetical protein